MDFQLVVLRGRSASTAIKLGDPATTAGRGEECQLRIKSSQVSRRHCQFFEKNGMLLVKDLGSSNGTYLNGKRIEGQRVLEPGDELAIGPVKLRVEKLGQSAGAVAGTPARPAASKPGDTAVPAKISPGASSDEFEIDFDETPEPASEEKTIAASKKPDPKPAAAPTPAAASVKPAAPELPGSTEPDLADDAIADFLLDIKLDEDE